MRSIKLVSDIETDQDSARIAILNFVFNNQALPVEIFYESFGDKQKLGNQMVKNHVADRYLTAGGQFVLISCDNDLIPIYRHATHCCLAYSIFIYHLADIVSHFWNLMFRFEN